MFEYTIDQVKKYMLENKNYISKYSVVILTQGTISDLKISPYTDVMGITKTRYYRKISIIISVSLHIILNL
jgi:aromatic ring-opening dioxygenase LigB subunit